MSHGSELVRYRNRVKRLEKRRDWLRERIDLADLRGKVRGHDKGEYSALDWAIPILRQYVDDTEIGRGNLYWLRQFELLAQKLEVYKQGTNSDVLHVTLNYNNTEMPYAFVELGDRAMQIPNLHEYYILPTIQKDGDTFTVVGYSFVHRSRAATEKDMKRKYGAGNF